MSTRIRITAVVASLALSSLLGCATRDWIAADKVPHELTAREALVTEQLRTATGPARQRLRLIESSLIAARRALDDGRLEHARVDLQTAVDLMDGVK